MLQCKTKWKKEQLKNILEDSYAGGTPNRSREDFYGGTIPWVTSGEVNQSKIIETNEYITDLGYKNSSAKRIPKDTVLLAMYGATAGQVSMLKIPATANQAVLAIIPCKELDKNYLYHNLRYFKERILFSAQGSGQTNLSKELVEKYKITFPMNTEEQQRIANILSTCDEVIEKTEETIEKYKQIKAGMMQDLFTRGLDANGKLRPTYAQTPDHYKYAEELDRYIPKEWEVRSLSILGEFKNGLNKDKKCFGHGTKFVNIIDAYKEYLDIGSLDRVETNNNDLLVYSLKNNDLIFVRSSVKPEGVGYNTIFLGADEPIVYCGFMIRFRLYESDNINAQFLNYYFRSDYFRRALIAKSTVSANTNINQDSLNQLYAILPKEKEQNKIVDIIDNMNKNISFEEQYLNKYKQIKQGLMKRLLTPPADAEIVEE